MAKKKKKKNLPAEPSAEVSANDQPSVDYSRHNESIAFSLTHMTPDMIDPSPLFDPGAMAAEKRSEYVRRGFLILCSLVFVFSLWSIIKTLSDYKKSDDFYAELENSLESLDGSNSLGLEIPDSPTAPFGTRLSNAEGSSLDNALFERMKTRISALQQINSDICGWINIPGTQNINYPIVQGTDNDYYLTREFKGGYLAAGSIFLDYRCDRDFNANHNTVIYGHNMQNGLMFSEIISFLDEKFFNENRYIYIYTEFGVYTYEVFAVYKTDYKYKYIETDFLTHTDFVDFAYEMKANSIYQREGIDFNENSRMITLSTCTNGLRTDRYCVQALLVDAYNK